MPFAPVVCDPSPLQKLLHYYGIVRLPVLLRYFDLVEITYLCLFTLHQNRTSRVSYKSLNKSHAPLYDDCSIART